MDTTFLIDLITNTGPMAVIAIFFIWQDSRRDKRNAELRDKLEEYIRTELQNLIRENKRVMEELADQIKSSKR
jgi:hypothetical protein